MKENIHIWEKFLHYQSAPYVQKFLSNCYKNSGEKDADSKSYENCYPFIYYVKHAKNYYQLAKNSPSEIKPVLLFYGMIQLIKGCLLTVDPNYPESTHVLAHGVSTRKRKKRNYSFMSDEVKIQKNGLFSHFSTKMFHVEQLSIDRFKMDTLLARIPEMNETFHFLNKQSKLHEITFLEEKTVSIPIHILDDFKMTFERFKDFFQAYTKVKIENIQHNKKEMIITVKKQLDPFHCAPFYYHHLESYYVPKQKEQFIYIDEVMVHYLILYNLSMICRYETEWWNELFHTYSSNDYPFIERFLTVTAYKIPDLLLFFLHQQRE
ncbi:YaaC family protein [Bacillus taeanensis]|uniref:YaaC family protein n=1 Tax=Bacillus taeanensis TaxID=273032 RepID=A0A366XRD8_9BACI|nr:YaaC family protein [Bacillus taeanensis]RBW67339.1 hypothetical protein DS031_22835 [Bacillus taeanensis]